MIDAMGAVTTIARDLFGNVTQLTQGGTQNGYAASVTRQFWYDARLRLCRHRAPEFGDELFAYDALDRLSMSSRGEAAASGCATPSAGIRTSLAYDALDRVTATDFAGATPDAAMSYDGEGNLLSASRAGGAVWTYQYNALNAISQEKLIVDARTYQFDYSYDAQGALSGRQGPGGTLAYTPDAFGRPTGVSVAATPYVSGVTYHANGLTAGASYANGFTLTQTQDARGRLFHAYATRPGAPTATSLLHYYDARGKIVQLVNWAVAGEDRSFGYDANGRLLSSTGPWGSGSYVYDALGNMRQRNEGAAGSSTISYDASNRVSQSVVAGLGTRAYVYDARGNTTGVGGQGFTYDYSNQPVALYGAVTASYAYDGNFKRVKEVRAGKTVYTVYSRVSGGLVFRDEATDNKTTSYLSAGGASVRLTSTGGGAPVAEYIHTDHLGSPVAATGGSGAVAWRESYTPFGAERLNPAANDNSTGYTGHLKDDASGLVYMQARYYDPTNGRFLSTDPIGYADQLNLYAYAANDPLNYVDPTGECNAAVGAFAGSAAVSDGPLPVGDAVAAAALAGSCVYRASRLIAAAYTTYRIAKFMRNVRKAPNKHSSAAPIQIGDISAMETHASVGKKVSGALGGTFTGGFVGGFVTEGGRSLMAGNDLDTAFHDAKAGAIIAGGSALAGTAAGGVVGGPAGWVVGGLVGGLVGLHGVLTEDAVKHAKEHEVESDTAESAKESKK